MAGIKNLLAGVSAAATLSTAVAQGNQPPLMDVDPAQKAEIAYNDIVLSESCLVNFNRDLANRKRLPTADDEMKALPEVERAAGLSPEGPKMGFAVRWGLPRNTPLGSFEPAETLQLCGQMSVVVSTDSAKKSTPMAAMNAAIGLPVIKYVADNVRGMLVNNATPEQREAVRADGVEQLTKVFSTMGGYSFNYAGPVINMPIVAPAAPAAPVPGAGNTTVRRARAPLVATVAGK